MKMKPINRWNGVLAAGLIAIAACAMQAEDVVQERFRKAMVAEEADQDLPAAVRGYESVLEGAETPLRLAATALYRLGECHRKLGQTNEATAAFERLAREFVGQTNLVRLARQNLAALGLRESSTASERTVVAAPANANPAVQKAQADLAEAARIERVIEMSKSGDGSSTRDILEAGFPSSELDLIKKRLFDLKFRFRDAPDKDKEGNQAGFERLKGQILELEKDYEEGLFRLGQRKKVEAEVLRRGAQAQLAALGVAPPELTAKRDPEEVEIERLRVLEKESPDLLRHGMPNGVSPMDDAVAKGHRRIVEHLISRGIPIDGPRRPGQANLLETAVVNGRVAMVDLLLSRGADVNERGSQDATVLHWAVVRKYEAVVERLLKSKPHLEMLSGKIMEQPPSTALGLAALIGEPSLVRRLVLAGAKVQQPPGSDPLPFRALKSKSLATLEAVLEASADPREVYRGRTVLHEAVLAESPEKTVPIIVAKGGLLDARTSSGETPLLWAMSQKLAKATSRTELVAMLLKMGANPNPGIENPTPLMFAVQQGNVELVHLLLDSGADPKIGPIKGFLMVNQALDRDDELLELLLKRGAEADPVSSRYLRGGSDPRPIDLAVDARLLTKIHLLLDHGVDPSLRNGMGYTPLEWLNRTALPGSPAKRFAGQVSASAAEVAALLRSRGGAFDHPTFEGPSVRRTSSGAGKAVFRADATNRITAVEALAIVYGWLDPVGRIRDVRRGFAKRSTQVEPRRMLPGDGPGFEHPDWERMMLRRPKDGGGWEETPLRLSLLISATNCDQAPLLRNNDVIEIPERAHPLGDSDLDKGTALWPLITNCLYTARYTFVIAGSTQVVGAGFESDVDVLMPDGRPAGLCDWMERIGFPANVDLSRVRVRRRAFRDQPAWVETFDLSKDQPEKGDLFLRDGDVIEVPEGNTPPPTDPK
jgi:ankyrin repeat protein